MQLTMNKPLLSTKELLHSWSVHPISPKTFRRERQRFDLKPVAFDGRTHMFDPDDVERAKAQRLAAKLAQVD